MIVYVPAYEYMIEKDGEIDSCSFAVRVDQLKRGFGLLLLESDYPYKTHY